MTRNGRNGQHFDPSSTERKMPIQTVPEMSDRQHVAVTDINNTEKINFHDGYMMGSGSEKQKISSWFLKRKVFLEMMCDTKSSSNIFLIGLLFAVLSGCSISLTVIFLGRIKDILLTDEPTAASFRTGIYEQIIVLTFLIAFTGVTHFGMHLSTTVLGDRIRIHLKRCYDGIHNQKQLDEEVVKEIIENVNLMEKGSESFGMQCRNIATVILSLIICFYYEARLSLAILSAVPLVIILDIFSRRLSKKANVLLSNKFFQTVQMEKELLLLKNPTDNIAKDECLMRLSANMRSCTRQAIFRQVWKSSQHGILSFMLFTLVGCGLLYGGYLLRINPMVKKGDIFIVVLSMTLIIGSISTTAKYCSVIKKGAHAAIYIKNHRQFDHGFMLTQNGNQRNSVNGITTTLISRPGIKNSAVFPKQNLIISFISGTRSVLRNYHNHKLFLLIGFALAIARGFEQAAYNLIMEQVFTALLGDSPNIKVLTLCAIQFSAIGFAAFISGTASTALVTVASEHMAVSFRVILARHLLKITDKEPLSKSEINSLVNDNLSLTVRAKSLYYPKLSELLTRITSITTNIIIGFIFSWEITLLGLFFVICCLCMQIEIEFGILTHCCKHSNIKESQKKTRLLKSCKHFILRAVNFSIAQTFGFTVKTICYAMSAYVCYQGYKHQTQAFLSVISIYTASRDTVQLPNLFRKVCKSWHAVHRIFACMHCKPSRTYMPSISRNIRLQY